MFIRCKLFCVSGLLCVDSFSITTLTIFICIDYIFRLPEFVEVHQQAFLSVDSFFTLR